MPLPDVGLLLESKRNMEEDRDMELALSYLQLKGVKRERLMPARGRGCFDLRAVNPTSPLVVHLGGRALKLQFDLYF